MHEREHRLRAHRQRLHRLRTGRASRNGASIHYSSSVVALDSESGRVSWSGASRWSTRTSGTTTPPRSPCSSILETGQGVVPALAQATKMGHVFLLDRRTGPLDPRRGGAPGAPRTARPGRCWRPPSPSRPTSAPLHPTALSAPTTPSGSRPGIVPACRELIERFRYDGHPFTPPTTVEGSIQYPINMGGANWGSVSIDPEPWRALREHEPHRGQRASCCPVRTTTRCRMRRARTGPSRSCPMHGTPYAVKTRSRCCRRWVRPAVRHPGEA